MVKSRSVVFSTRRKLGHGVASYNILKLGAHSIAKKRNLSNYNSLVALPPLPKLSVKFQRNRLPNFQDIPFFSVRPPPKFWLINLFMSSLSPAALTRTLTTLRNQMGSRPEQPTRERAKKAHACVPLIICLALVTYYNYNFLKVALIIILTKSDLVIVCVEYKA